MTLRLIFPWVKSAIALMILSASAWYVWTHFEWHQIVPLVSQTKLVPLIIGTSCLYLIYLCLRTLRWLLMIRSINTNVRFVDLYLPTAILLSLSLITPAQLGEAFKVEILKRRGYSGRAVGMGSFIVERLLDMLVVLLLACLSWPMTIARDGLTNWYWALAAGVFATTAILVLLMRYSSEGRVGLLLEQLRSTIQERFLLLKITTLTILSWLIVGLLWQIALASIDIKLNLTQAIAMMTLSTLGILLSFIPGGLGISEILIAELLPLFGVNIVHAQAGALVMRLVGLLWLGIGVLHLGYWWLRYKPHST